MLDRYLEDLESRIDPDVEETLWAAWEDFGEDRIEEEIFVPQREQEAPSSVEWPKVRTNACMDDFEQMALQQFGGASDQLEAGSGFVLNVRANYGTGIIPSLFGAEMFIMPEETNTLPTTRPMGEAAMRGWLDRGVPDLEAGLGARVFEMGRRYARIAQDYPKIGRYVTVYHPDMQGPLDLLEMLWGSDMFLGLVDEPELVHQLLDLICETYIQFMEKWHAICPPRNGHAAHWGFVHKGRIMLRDDSAMNLSPAMFDTYIKPYDQRLLVHFGGGAMHACGRVDHYIENASRIKGLNAFHMSQPDLNDVDEVLAHTAGAGIKLLSVRRDVAEAALERGIKLHGNVQSYPMPE